MHIDATAQRVRPGYQAPFCGSSGSTASALFAPDGYSLWLLVAHLDAGASIEWTDVHGDEGVFVQRGRVTVEGSTCDAGGAIVVESGVPAVLRAETEAEVVHVGPSSPVPPSGGLFGAADANAEDLETSEGHLRVFADAVVRFGVTRKQIRNLWLFDNWRVTVAITAAFAQTPGPGAGARMEKQRG